MTETESLPANMASLTSNDYEPKRATLDGERKCSAQALNICKMILKYSWNLPVSRFWMRKFNIGG